MHKISPPKNPPYIPRGAKQDSFTAETWGGLGGPNVESHEGDVQPLAVLASSLAERPDLQVSFVTHAELEKKLRSPGWCDSSSVSTHSASGLLSKALDQTSAEHAKQEMRPTVSLPRKLDDRQITHLICARLKDDRYDFFRGVLGLLPVLFLV